MGRTQILTCFFLQNNRAVEHRFQSLDCFYGNIEGYVGYGICDRRACSRSEHFRIDERPRSGG